MFKVPNLNTPYCAALLPLWQHLGKLDYMWQSFWTESVATVEWIYPFVCWEGWGHPSVCNNNNVIAAILACFRHSFASCWSILLPNFHFSSCKIQYVHLQRALCVICGWSQKSCCVVLWFCTLHFYKIVGIIRQLSVNAGMTINLDACVKTVVQQYIYDIAIGSFRFFFPYW